MDKRNRISISFKREYQHIFEHLQSIPNKSDYIGKALEAYMSGEHSSITHGEIREIVMEILQTQGDLSPTLIQPAAPPGNQISDDDAELISQLF